MSKKKWFIVTFHNVDGIHEHMCYALMQGESEQDIEKRAPAIGLSYFGFFDDGDGGKDGGESDTDVQLSGVKEISDADAEVILRTKALPDLTPRRKK
jgi:hypothetical protein